MSVRTTLAAAAALLVSTSAFAADLPSRAAPPVYAPVIPVFTWTGFYAGTLTGYGFSDGQFVRTTGTTPATAAALAAGRRPQRLGIEADGLTSVGGGIGYDYQFVPGSGIVVGLAADATLMDLGRRRGFVGPTAFGSEATAFRSQLDWLGTVRGRVGYAFDRVLVYGTGGFAYGNTLYRAAFANPAGAFNHLGQYDGMSTGYVYGGGVEYALPADSILAKFNLLSYLNLIQSQAITIKAEYLRYDLGHRTVFSTPVGTGAGTYVSRFNTEGNLVRGGFTYRFGTL